jgi:O-antigen/teichoic acid export membrane protein
MSIKKNTLWNLFGSGAPMLIGLVVVPYLLARLGVERLGVLTLIWALIGYFSVFDLGLGRALTQQVSALRATGGAGQLAATIRSGLALLFWVGAAGTVLALLLLLSWNSAWLDVAPALQADVTRCLVVAALSIPATTLTSGLKGVLEGLERFRDVNLLRTLLGIANFVSPVLAIAWQGPSLTVIVMFLVAARLIILALHGVFVWRVMRGQQWAKGSLDRAAVRSLFAFGSWMTLSNIVSPLMVVADRFLVASVLGAAEVAYYAVPSDVLLRALIIPAALSSTIFPVFARYVVNEVDRARNLYRRSSLAVLGIMGPLMLATALGSHFGLSLWLGASFADQAYLCVVVLAAGILLNSLAQVPCALVLGARRVKQTALLHVGEFVVYAPLLYAMTKIYGIVGAAAVWTARAGIDLLALHLMARRVLQPADGR